MNTQLALSGPASVCGTVNGHKRAHDKTGRPRRRSWPAALPNLVGTQFVGDFPTLAAVPAIKTGPVGSIREIERARSRLNQLTRVVDTIPYSRIEAHPV